jgi:pimeloyl-ACP methyl ester carboxylesterase
VRDHPLPGGEAPSAAEARRVSSTGGVELAVHRLPSVGSPHAPLVLLAHATGFHGRVWSPCAARLPLRCWAPDLRGHGASPLPPGVGAPEPDPAVLAWDRFADDVLAVIDDLAASGECSRSGLLAAGHSKGGTALLLAEQRRPGTFDALYLYEPVVFPPEMLAGRRENPLAEGARRRRRSFPSLEAALANYSAKPPLEVLHPAALDAYVRHGFTAEPDGTVTLACPPEVEATVYAQAMWHDAFDHLGEVACPVVVACGRPEPGPSTAAPAVADALPHGELSRHADLGHFGPLEDPAAIAAEMARHLR